MKTKTTLTFLFSHFRNQILRLQTWVWHLTEVRRSIFLLHFKHLPQPLSLGWDFNNFLCVCLTVCFLTLKYNWMTTLVIVKLELNSVSFRRSDFKVFHNYIVKKDNFSRISIFFIQNKLIVNLKLVNQSTSLNVSLWARLTFLTN